MYTALPDHAPTMLLEFRHLRGASCTPKYPKMLAALQQARQASFLLDPGTRNSSKYHVVSLVMNQSHLVVVDPYPQLYLLPTVDQS